MKESRTPKNFARFQAVRIQSTGSKTVAAKWPVINSRRASRFISRQTNSASSGECVRARVFVAEKKYREADRLVGDVIKTFEQGGEPALLADALTIQGVVWARLGGFDGSINILRRAVDVAQESGALTQAGHAALTLIEEHGATWRLPESEVIKVYQRADELLRDTQDAEDKERLRACARIVIRRLWGMQLHDKNFTFYGAVEELEGRLIEQALELEGGSITRAAKRLGLKRQTLSNMLKVRHKKLHDKRTPPIPRRRSIIKD